jgi:hypothetical protein
MDLSTAIPHTDENQQSGFCALEYRPRDWETSPFLPLAAPVVMLVLRDMEGNLHFLIHPEMATIVQEGDMAYIESLLIDFHERAKLHPAALFKQLSSLAVGPLITREVGSKLAEHPSLLEISRFFVQL